MRKLIIGHRLIRDKLSNFLIDYRRFMIGSNKKSMLVSGDKLLENIGDIYNAKLDVLLVSNFLPNSVDDKSQDRLFAIQECGAKEIVCTGDLVRNLLPGEVELINLPKYSRMKYIIGNRDSINLDSMLQSIMAFDNEDISFIESCFPTYISSQSDVREDFGC